MNTFTEITELLAAVAVGVLSAIFISAFFVILLVLHKHKLYYGSYTAQRCENDFGQMAQIKIGDDTFLDERIDGSQTDLESLCINDAFERILSNDQWIEDASGLIPHCLAILKGCRSLTERLTSLSMGVINTNGSRLRQIVEIARQISSRVDDMVGSMYPPLNLQLLEARAASLTLSVKHLAIITQVECKNKNIPMEWVEKGIKEMESHINIIREAAINNDQFSHTSGSSSFDSSTVISTTF